MIQADVEKYKTVIHTIPQPQDGVIELFFDPKPSIVIGNQTVTVVGFIFVDAADPRIKQAPVIGGPPPGRFLKVYVDVERYPWYGELLRNSKSICLDVDLSNNSPNSVTLRTDYQSPGGCS